MTDLDSLCIAAKRVRLGYRETQQAFAVRLGCSVYTVSKWETGRISPTNPLILSKLASAARDIGYVDEAKRFEKFLPQAPDGSSLAPPAEPLWRMVEEAVEAALRNTSWTVTVELRAKKPD